MPMRSVSAGRGPDGPPPRVRRRAGLFSAASLAGGFATAAAWLLTARAVQGIGGALIAPTSLALIVTTFAEGPARDRAMSVVAAPSGGGAAASLIADGLLTSYLSWRWVLFVNVPIGILTAAAAPILLAESARRRGRFDLSGAVTGTGGVAYWPTAFQRGHRPARRLALGRP